MLSTEPVLCRNYDYSPDLFEQVVYSSAFTGRKVIGTSDCLWGLLDGMNDAGLVVSLTFGGAAGAGDGFAIPLVVRYVLEVATTIAEAKTVLARLPVGMSYNLTMVDATGATATAYLSPGNPAEFSDDAIATNHKGEVPQNPAHAKKFRSVERREALKKLVATENDVADFAAAFTQAPLRSTTYSKAFGTLYTALYRPSKGVVEYIWPDQTWTRGFDDPDQTLPVVLVGS